MMPSSSSLRTCVTAIHRSNNSINARESGNLIPKSKQPRMASATHAASGSGRAKSRDRHSEIELIAKLIWIRRNGNSRAPMPFGEHSALSPARPEKHSPSPDHAESGRRARIQYGLGGDQPGEPEPDHKTPVDVGPEDHNRQQRQGRQPAFVPCGDDARPTR